jgi:hypothetical protein
MSVALTLLLLSAGPDAGVPDCIDTASVVSHFTLVGAGGTEKEGYVAVRELYDGTEAGGGREAVDCSYDGLAGLWDDSMRRTGGVCRAANTVFRGAGRPGGVRLRFVRTGAPGTYAVANGQAAVASSTAEPVFDVYASAFDRKSCTAAAASKTALDGAKKFADAHGLALEGFKVIPLGNRQVYTQSCRAAKNADCSQTLTVKAGGRNLTVRLDVATLPELRSALDGAEPEAWSFEVAPSIGIAPTKLNRVASTTFTGMVNGSSWSRLGSCELFSDGDRLWLKVSLLHGFLGMAWEEARFVELW